MRKVTAISVILAASLFAPVFLLADDAARLLSIDHYVKVKSTVPAIEGKTTQIYVREVVQASTALRDGALTDRVALFIHGAGTPAEVSFDVPYQDYSWMGFLAHNGFDVYAMDTTGYGRSTRPSPMNDPCNLSKAQQEAFVPVLLASPCAASYPSQMTTIASDWNDIDAVVDQVRALRHVDKLNLLAWSLGGPRSGGYTVLHPEKVRALVVLAPAYNRNSPSDAPKQVPANGATFNTQSEAEFTANWDRQVGCPGQYEPAAHAAVWTKMLESDPVGATWGAGARRAPQTTTWGWNLAAAAKVQAPYLMVSGAHDKQVNPDRVRELYNDLGSKNKVFVDLACSSHNAMWEKNHLLLFRASLEWLTKGTVNGSEQGMLKLGY